MTDRPGRRNEHGGLANRKRCRIPYACGEEWCECGAKDDDVDAWLAEFPDLGIPEAMEKVAVSDRPDTMAAALDHAMRLMGNGGIVTLTGVECAAVLAEVESLRRVRGAGRDSGLQGRWPWRPRSCCGKTSDE
jgi:hypothetical protein